MVLREYGNKEADVSQHSAHLKMAMRKVGLGHGRDKVHTVMSEFKRGTLRSSSGAKVQKRSQAIAIALSEAGLSRKKKKKK